MIKLDIPGYGDIEINNLVLDYNGTLAKDGFLLDGIRELIDQLTKLVNVFVITADTFGSVEGELKDLSVKVITISRGDEKNQKLKLIQKLGSQNTVSMGNGYNDELMLKESIVGICITGQEGCSTKALIGSDLVVNRIQDGLELLIFPNRLKATLRY